MRKELVAVAVLACISLATSITINALTTSYITYPFLGTNVERDGIYAQVIETAPQGLDNPSIGNIADAILTLIDNAENSLTIEVYTIYQSDNGPTADIQNAIYAAASRGVKIRILIDDDIYSTVTRDPDTFVMFENFQSNENIEVKRSKIDNTAYLMHSKVFNADNRVVVVSSANQSFTAMTSDREIGFLVRSDLFARAMAEIFEYGWSGTEDLTEFENGWPIDWISPVVTQTYPTSAPTWVPQTLNEVVGLLNSAQKTIRVPMYVYSGSPTQLKAAMDNAAGRGIEIKMIIDKDYSSTNPDDDFSYPFLAEFGKYPNVQLKEARLTSNASYHAKTVVVDGERGYVGSANWTSTSMTARRELGVKFVDNTLASAIEQMFLTDWNSKYLGWIVESANQLLAISLMTGGIFLSLLALMLIYRRMKSRKYHEGRKSFIAENWASSRHELT